MSKVVESIFVPTVIAFAVEQGIGHVDNPWAVVGGDRNAALVAPNDGKYLQSLLSEGDPGTTTQLVVCSGWVEAGSGRGIGVVIDPRDSLDTESPWALNITHRAISNTPVRVESARLYGHRPLGDSFGGSAVVLRETADVPRNAGFRSDVLSSAMFRASAMLGVDAIRSPTLRLGLYWSCRNWTHPPIIHASHVALVIRHTCVAKEPIRRVVFTRGELARVRRMPVQVVRKG